MVMHTLNCTYGGGINHEAESCCCFLGRMAEQVRRLNCQDCCQNSLIVEVDLVGVASFPCHGCQRCSADSGTCGKCFGLQIESLSLQYCRTCLTHPAGAGIDAGTLQGLTSSRCYKPGSDLPRRIV